MNLVSKGPRKCASNCRSSCGCTNITLKELRHPQATAYWPSRSALAARRCVESPTNPPCAGAQLSSGRWQARFGPVLCHAGWFYGCTELPSAASLHPLAGHHRQSAEEPRTALLALLTVVIAILTPNQIFGQVVLIIVGAICEHLSVTRGCYAPIFNSASVIR